MFECDVIAWDSIIYKSKLYSFLIFTNHSIDLKFLIATDTVFNVLSKNNMLFAEINI